MPTYTYKCDSCGVVFDKFQKFSDKSLTRCPECSKGKVKRVLQPAAIVFKGSGWYATDNRSPSGQSARKADTDSGTDKSDKTDKADKTEKSVTKPTKKEAKSAKADD
jgi:putative FmdB family regulatory protein